MSAAISLTSSELQRFEAFLSKNEDQCWMWTGAVDRRGYGIFQTSSLVPRTRRANRLAYQIWIGRIPKGLQVQHKCDRPSCCNPAHLFVGTPAQNSAQMVALGRAATGLRHGMAKLSDEQIIEIRRLCTDGVPYRTVAARFAISESHVRNIDRRRRRLGDGRLFQR